MRLLIDLLANNLNISLQYCFGVYWDFAAFVVKLCVRFYQASDRKETFAILENLSIYKIKSATVHSFQAALTCRDRRFIHKSSQGKIFGFAQRKLETTSSSSTHPLSGCASERISILDSYLVQTVEFPIFGRGQKAYKSLSSTLDYLDGSLVLVSDINKNAESWFIPRKVRWRPLYNPAK